MALEINKLVGGYSQKARVKGYRQSFLQLGLINGSLAIGIREFVIIAPFLIARLGFFHAHPVGNVLRCMVISGKDAFRRNGDHTVFIQQRVAHVHMVEDFKRLLGSPSGSAVTGFD